MHQNKIGWDVGGAHLKAAWVNSAGEVEAVYQEACHLWEGLHTLENALANILKKLPTEDTLHAVTMTGELVDLFTTRAQGVTAIIKLMQKVLPPQTLRIYAGRLGFLAPENITTEQMDDIASANWLASASYVAQQVETGIFIDIGSTTTDILLLQQQKVAAQGYTDFKRLQSDELVYTGLVRTAVMAVAQSVYFRGVKVGLMSEYFATMADVYRVTGELHEKNDQTETADGGAKTPEASAMRLARMLGCNAEEFSFNQWQQLAYALKEQQLYRIQQAVEKQLSRIDSHENMVLVGAGIGRFLVQAIALRVGVSYQDFDSFFHTEHAQPDMQIADCAPAVAVAYLA